jgi:vacuolar-type H+-ATPase catalytic subunit A/Vma1
MNPKVEDFLSKRRALQRDEALIQREEHLISLGLVEDRTEERVCYFDEWDGTKACKWDANKQKYYKVVELPVPIEVTDEEYEQILKYAPINESKKRANISAESELAKMVNSVVTRVIEEMSMEDQAYNYTQSDTTLVSTYKVFKGMNTICQTKTKLVDNVYVTYVTKEISVDCISDMFYFDDEADKAEFKKKLRKRKKNK